MHTNGIMNFANKLVYWYLENKRNLPWRKNKNPYSIWLSEIILQQTKIEQGLPYFIAFLEEYPTIFDLAKAPEHDILKLWQGLGYYSRARNLHHTAKYIVEHLNGKFPANYEGLLQLKGIGDYTASAIASICYEQPQAVVDGNVYRVLSRVFGIFTPINTSDGKKEFKALAMELLDKQNPGTYNQALMEFGALWCKPKNPLCTACVFQTDCHAFRNKEIDKLPVKSSKTKVRNRYFNYLVVNSSDEKTVIQQRTEPGIWKNLYEFPLIETEATSFLHEEQVKELINYTSVESVTLYNEIPIIHKLSHQHLHIRFWIIDTTTLDEKGVRFDTIGSFPVPIVLHNFITKFPF